MDNYKDRMIQLVNELGGNESESTDVDDLSEIVVFAKKVIKLTKEIEKQPKSFHELATDALNEYIVNIKTMPPPEILISMAILDELRTHTERLEQIENRAKYL